MTPARTPYRYFCGPPEHDLGAIVPLPIPDRRTDIERGTDVSARRRIQKAENRRPFPRVASCVAEVIAICDALSDAIGVTAELDDEVARFTISA